MSYNPPPPSGFPEPQHYNSGYYSQNQPPTYSQPYAAPQQPYGAAGYSTQPPTYQSSYGQASNFKQSPSNNSLNNQNNRYNQNYQTPPPRTNSAAEKWNNNPKYNDVWATILFVIHLIAFVILVKQFSADIDDASNNNGDKNSNTVKLDNGKFGGLFAIAVLVASALTAIYFLAMRRFTGTMIKVSFWLNVALLVASAVIMFIGGAIGSGIIFLFFALIFALFYYWWRRRIPFAKVMLQSVIDVTKMYPSTFLVGFLGMLLMAGWNIFFGSAVCGASNAFPSAGGIVIIFMVFSYYWTTQVMKNVVHTSVSGVFATYYFFGQAAPDGTVTVPVSNPTSAAFKRTMTTSFGSVCYGSLIIAIIQTIRTLVRGAKEQAMSEGSVGAAFCLCCLECLITCIEDMFAYLNRYAFTQVAIYGKAYCQAAKDTWNLFKQRGIDALINDNLIGNVLAMGAFVVGVITGSVAYWYSSSVDVVYCSGPGDCGTTLYFILIAFVAAILGFVIFDIVSAVITSGVVTTFVCLAENPETLRRNKPQLYSKILETYPEVQFGVGRV